MPFFKQEIFEKSLQTVGKEDEYNRALEMVELVRLEFNDLLSKYKLDAFIGLTRNPAWTIDYVGGDNAARFANAIDLAVNRLLDIKFFNHRLNDPISFSDEDEVVLNIAAGDSLSVALLHERRRLSFQHALNGV